MVRIYEYIKKNALAYSVQYSDEKEIDRINIRQATLQTMHNVYDDIRLQLYPWNRVLVMCGGVFVYILYLPHSLFGLVSCCFVVLYKCIVVPFRVVTVG